MCWGRVSLCDVLVSSTITFLVNKLWLLTTKVCTECRNTRAMEIDKKQRDINSETVPVYGESDSTWEWELGGGDSIPMFGYPGSGVSVGGLL